MQQVEYVHHQCLTTGSEFKLPTAGKPCRTDGPGAPGTDGVRLNQEVVDIIMQNTRLGHHWSEILKSTCARDGQAHQPVSPQSQSTQSIDVAQCDDNLLYRNDMSTSSRLQDASVTEPAERSQDPRLDEVDSLQLGAATSSAACGTVPETQGSRTLNSSSCEEARQPMCERSESLQSKIGALLPEDLPQPCDVANEQPSITSMNAHIASTSPGSEDLLVSQPYPPQRRMRRLHEVHDVHDSTTSSKADRVPSETPSSVGLQMQGSRFTADEFIDEFLASMYPQSGAVAAGACP